MNVNDSKFNQAAYDAGREVWNKALDAGMSSAEAWALVKENDAKIESEVINQAKEETKFPSFPKYSCVGDKINWVNGEFLLTATIHQDCDTKPEEFDCYHVDDIILFNLDQWFYCGIVISVEKQGIMIEENAVALWGIECNFPGSDNSYLAEVVQELEDEAIEAGKAEMQRMIQVLQS